MILAPDTETTGSDFWHGCKPFMVTACDGTHNYCWTGKVNPYDRREVTWEDHVLQEIQDKFDEADTLVFHNAKFDIRALETIGIDAKQWDKVEDTLIASHVCCSGEPHGLKPLSYKYLDYYNEEEKELARVVQLERQRHPDYDLAKADHKCFPGLKGAKVSWYKMDYWVCMEECAKYGITDVEMTWMLWQMYQDVLEKEGLEEQYHTRRQLLEITYSMEEVGLNFYTDGPDGVKQEIKRLMALQSMLRGEIQKETKMRWHFNPQNKQHIQWFLFDILKLEVQYRTAKTKEPATTKEAIESYIRQNPDNITLQHFSDYRQAGTKISYLQSYLNWECPDGRIRSNFLITGTRETRQTAISPNTKNIDKKLRHIFGPPPGYIWLDFDLVNIELRIWTYEVGNKEMIEVFERGDSVHLLIASLIHPDLMDMCEKERTQFKEVYDGTWYTWCKNGTFAIIYGASPSRANGHNGYRKLGSYEKVAKRFPEVPLYSRRIIQEAWDNLHNNSAPYVTCVGGYRLDVDMEEPFKACNYKIQGSAGYFITEAQINVHHNPDYHRTEAKMVNEVYDSIVIEVLEANYTKELELSLQKSIEDAGRKYIPTCEASCKIIRNTEVLL